MTLKIGGHLSISGGYKNALQKTLEIGGNCLQIFSTSPRGWRRGYIADDLIAEFLRLKVEFKIDPVYFHASYLVNLADASSTGHLSKESLIAELNLAPKMGVTGSIVHLGSFKTDEANLFPEEGYSKLIKNIKIVLEKTPKETLFMIENAGNRKIGKSLDQIAQIIKDVDDDRLRVCLDTCHLHAAGYDLRSAEKLELFLKDFDNKIGLKKLEVWHINDSRDPFASLRDRHDNIGEGEVGIETFRSIVNHPKLKSIPLIIETPGFDETGPDKKNLDILKGLVSN